MTFNASDYVDVAERIRVFKEKHPEGTLCAKQPPQVVTVNGQDYIWYGALAYRSPDDPCPGEGWAAEPVPGKTNFTRDSELQNAETSAWGRAIVALGFETKHIASKEEVRNRQVADETPPPTQPKPEAPKETSQFEQPTPPITGTITEKQWKMLCGMSDKLVQAGHATPQSIAARQDIALPADADTHALAKAFAGLTKTEASELIGKLTEKRKRIDQRADKEIPF